MLVWSVKYVSSTPLIDIIWEVRVYGYNGFGMIGLKGNWGRMTWRSIMYIEYIVLYMRLVVYMMILRVTGI
jgi:hypothetical protein